MVSFAYYIAAFPYQGAAEPKTYAPEWSS